MLEKHVKAHLILESGEKFPCQAFGHIKETIGEMVFVTSMAGYQELLTDPVYAGKLIVMTSPLIGNAGINLEDQESEKIWASGVIMREKCDYPNNWRFEMELEGFLKQHNIMGVDGLDTRALTKIIRDKGEMKAMMTTRGNQLTSSQIKGNFDAYHYKNGVAAVSCKEPYEYAKGGQKVAVLDLGVKASVLDALRSRGLTVQVYPWDSDAGRILDENPDGIFISGGPGSPMDVGQLTATVQALAGEKPLLALGLGCQLLCTAFGGAVEKMQYGCHGDNYPVKDLISGKVYTTSQCRSFEITKLPEGAALVYQGVNRSSMEGFVLKGPQAEALGLQFYPSKDTEQFNTGYIYDQFVKNMEGGGLNA